MLKIKTFKSLALVSAIVLPATLIACGKVNNVVTTPIAEPPFVEEPNVTSPAIDPNAEVITHVIPELANLRISERRSGPGAPFYLNSNYGTGKKTLLEYLVEKIKARLPHGPEIAAVRDIMFDVNNRASYSAERNVINMNISDANWPAVAQSANLSVPPATYEEFADGYTEHMFQVLYHEYGHHIASVYLNADFRTDDAAPGRGVLKGLMPTTGDADGAKVFIETLDYYNDEKTALPKLEAKQIYGDQIYKLNALSNLFSRKGLFGDNGVRTSEEINLNINEVLAHRAQGIKDLNDAGEAVVSFGPDTLKYVSARDVLNNYTAYSPANIYGFFSMSELATIKLMEATALLPTIDSHPTTEPGDLFGNHLMAIKYSYAYSDGINTSPFATDYLFKPILDAQGKMIGTDNSNAKRIVKATQDRMGYTNGSDLSFIGYEPQEAVETLVNGPFTEAHYLKDTSKFRFGGYVDDARYEYVGYFDQTNTFKAARVHVAPFNYRAKKTQDARTYAEAEPGEKRYYYVVNDWLNRDEGAEKALYYSTDALGSEVKPFRNFNAKASSDGAFFYPLVDVKKTILAKVLYPTLSSDQKVKIAMRDNPDGVTQIPTNVVNF